MGCRGSWRPFAETSEVPLGARFGVVGVQLQVQ